MRNSSMLVRYIVIDAGDPVGLTALRCKMMQDSGQTSCPDWQQQQPVVGLIVARMQGCKDAMVLGCKVAMLQCCYEERQSGNSKRMNSVNTGSGGES